MTDLERTAYNEAGHVVVARCVGLRVAFVSIVRSGNRAGQTELELPELALCYGVSEYVSAWDHLTEICGGLVSEGYDPDNPAAVPPGARQDYADFKTIVTWPDSPYLEMEGSFEELISFHARRAGSILMANERFVGEVASWLLSLGRVTGQDIELIWNQTRKEVATRAPAE